MVKYFLGLLLLSGFVANAQKDSVTIYYDGNWEKVQNSDSASYYKRAILEDDVWYVKAYYIDNNALAISGTFLYSPDSIKTGHFIYYYDNGTKNEEGDFVNDKRKGVWKGWHKSNGALGYIRTYNEGYKTGKPEAWNENGTKYAEEEYLTDINEIKSFDKKDSLGKVIPGDGVLVGTCKYYFPNGQMSSQEEWKNDSLVAVKFWDEKGHEMPVERDKDGSLSNCRVPEFKGGMQKLGKYLSENIKYPKKSRKNNEQGRVILKFSIDKDGSVVDAKVFRSSHHMLIDEEALRVVNTMNGMWKPGAQHNQPVKVLYLLPVTFRLDN